MKRVAHQPDASKSCRRRMAKMIIGIMTTIGYLQFFAEPYIMSPGGQGGPDNATLSIVLYMYQQGFKFYNLGYASAIAYVLFAIIVAFSLLQGALSRRMEKTS